MQYDITATRVLVETPFGNIESGKFVGYNPDRNMVIVEHDYEYLVEHPSDRVYIPEDT